ncbi:hypothetical protein BC628DRAFT_1343795, partial [Trametes gibbosa]
MSHAPRDRPRVTRMSPDGSQRTVIKSIRFGHEPQKGRVVFQSGDGHRSAGD